MSPIDYYIYQYL